jgi:hypothetical protein
MRTGTVSPPGRAGRGAKRTFLAAVPVQNATNGELKRRSRGLDPLGPARAFSLALRQETLPSSSGSMPL